MMALTLRHLFDSVNFLSDEDKTDQELLIFTNDAIAKVNMICLASFPYLEPDVDLTGEYEGFDETWQRALFVPFAVGRSKQAESSQFEYSDSYSEFNAGLLEFKATYTIPDYYKSTTTTPTHGEEDYSKNPFGW